VLLSAGPERVYSSQRTSRDIAPKVNAWLLLHQRLGHMGFERLVELVRSKRVDGLGNPSLVPADLDTARKLVRECRACVLGKHARTQFDHRGLERGRRAGDIIHMDTYPVKFCDAEGQQRVEHGLTMKDAFSKEAWHVRVLSKDQVAGAVIDMLKVIERSTGGKVRRLCIDGGTEFVNQTLERYLVAQGTLPRVSPPHTQALNGIAESSVRILKDGARTLVHHAGAPARLWHHAAAHAVWIWNRTRISNATNMTPYENGAGRVPHIRERSVGVWGCDCFVHQRKELRSGAMAAKSEPGIYLGHDERYNCATVLMLRTGKKVHSRDVRYFNDRFTHMRAYKQGREAMEEAADNSVESDDGPEDFEDEMPALGGMEQPSVEEKEADSGGPPDSEETEAEEEFKIEQILNSRVRGGVAQYQVKWEG
jgi:transposase InsO family protein